MSRSLLRPRQTFHAIEATLLDQFMEQNFGPHNWREKRGISHG
ncbi:MAG: hypothetical protein ABI076_04610 [Acidobacteriaceae bacterium]